MIDLDLKLRFEALIPVRIDDLNYGNHLGHAKHIAIIHQARVMYFKSNGLDEMNLDGVSVIVKKIDIEYLREAFFDELLKIKLYIKKIDKVSLSFTYLVTKGEGDKLVSRVDEVIYFMNKNGKVSRTPKSILNLGD